MTDLDTRAVVTGRSAERGRTRRRFDPKHRRSLVLTIVLRRQMISGLTFGAVK